MNEQTINNEEMSAEFDWDVIVALLCWERI